MGSGFAVRAVFAELRTGVNLEQMNLGNSERGTGNGEHERREVLVQLTVSATVRIIGVCGYRFRLLRQSQCLANRLNAVSLVSGKTALTPFR